MMAKITQSTDVNVPLQVAYEQLSRFEQYPRFLEDVEEVRYSDGTTLRWRVRVGSLARQWDAEIAEQVPGRRIALHSRDPQGPRATIELEENAVEGTRVCVTLDQVSAYLSPELQERGVLTMAERLERDLVRFKKYIEKIARDSGQWSGRAEEAAPSHSADAERIAGGVDGARGDASPASAETEAEPQGGGRPPWRSEAMFAWEEPIAMMRRMSKDMQQLFGRFDTRFLRERAGSRGAEPGIWTPAVEIIRSKDQVVVYVEVPGIPREDIHIEVVEQGLLIEGERRMAGLHERHGEKTTERHYGRFRRMVALPPGVDPQAVSATLKDGVLEVTVPLLVGMGRGFRVEIRGPG